MNKVFQSEEPETFLEKVVDGNLRSNCPMDDVYKVSSICILPFKGLH